MRPILLTLLAMLATPVTAQTAEGTAAETSPLPTAAILSSEPAADAPSPAPVPATPDFAALDKAALVLLCEQYHRMNRLLEQRLAQLEAPAGTGVDAASLAALQAQIASLEDRLSLWMAQSEEAAAGTDAIVLVDEATLGKPITPTPAYRYEYELNLIGEQGSTRLMRRDAEGKLHIEKVSFSDYRSDEIEVRVFFRNDSNRRARFNMLVGLGERRGVLGSVGNRVTLVGRGSYTTPFLVPGEVHPFTLKIPVDNAYQVDFAEIGRVRAFE